MTHFNSKHSHLREKAMRYFMTHTFEETMKRFDLTKSELKSLQTVAYKDPALKHLRKDTRCKRRWTLKDLLFVIRHAGLRPRSWIGAKLGRGGARVIKERLKTFNSGTKWLNGMPQTWAEELWPGIKITGIKTDAGPTGGAMSGNFHFIIIPWTECEKIMRFRRTPHNVRSCIRSMAKFQRWIHGVQDPRWVKRKLLEGLRA